MRISFDEPFHLQIQDSYSLDDLVVAPMVVKVFQAAALQYHCDHFAYQ